MRISNLFVITLAMLCCYAGALTTARADEPVTWPIDQETHGEDVFWMSDTPVRPDAGLYEGSYVITEVHAYIRYLIFNLWVDVTDQVSVKMCRDIAQKIEQELTYPGEVKVTVVRETRAVDYAR